MASTHINVPRGRQRRARKSHPARPFIVSLLILFSLATLSFVAHRLPSKRSTQLLTRDDPPWNGDETCHHVHRYKPELQCAFVQANCPDEEAGLFSYLTLYYCRLPNAKPLGFAIIAIWTALLFTTIGVAASDFFCINLSTMSNYLGMSESMAGVTFLAFGNGSPDVFSTFAAVRSHSGSLAVGELIGAAGFITAVVSGSMALIRPFHVYKNSFIRDVGFFIVAVAFSMYFLANGALALWECAVMVAFYVFYVLVVLFWHWFQNRRRRRRERDAVSRGHYTVTASHEDEAEEEYRDDDGSSRHSARPVSDEDFNNLERADYDDDYEDLNDEETRDKWMGELTSSMRITKPPDRNRTTISTPIRPSLVGALEFRAVLSSLQKSRNQVNTALNMRRYSDAPYYTSAQQSGVSGASDPEGSQNAFDASVEEYMQKSAAKSTAQTGRGRSMTVNEGAMYKAGRNQVQPASAPDLLGASPPRTRVDEVYGTFDSNASTIDAKRSPVVSVTSPTDEYFEAAPRSRSNTGDLLAPPTVDHLHRRTHSQPIEASQSPKQKPSRPKLTIPQSPLGSPKVSPLHSPYLAGLSSKSTSRTPSILLPPPEDPSTPGDSLFTKTSSPKPIAWWPSSVLPPPSVLARAIFPTLYGWREKSAWERTLGVLVTPSFFFLAITLPVVEPELDDDATQRPHSSDHNYAKSPYPLPSPHPHTHQHGTANTAVGIEESHHHDDDPMNYAVPIQDHTSMPVSSSREWDRWLVLVHSVTAPWFIVLVVWANTSLEPRTLLIYSLYSLLASLVVLLILLLTTTPLHPPRWHFLLCFVGFAVSITWISTIANEVVGVLKTIGVIFNMSDAILGLTIFAVGNSLGDLVADITVARLGYPVMALSACFGGPMLNILLGIGLSGLYMTIDKAERYQHKHPDKHLKFKPYHIRVSTTLLISAVALLVTLVGLLIAVPLNGWKMDKKIGWGLIILWIVATVGNVVVEITGLGDELL